MTKFVGVDYSMSSPCMCIISGVNITAYFLNEKKKYQNIYTLTNNFQIIGNPIPKYDSPEERWWELSEFFRSILYSIDNHDNFFVAIEDYSMGSRGKVFHIAENVGCLKMMLWLNGYKFITISPTQIKKFATGSGAAKKTQMLDAFKLDCGIDLSKIMGQEGKLDSPVTDVVDAYYIAKYAKVLYEQNSRGPNQTQT